MNSFKNTSSPRRPVSLGGVPKTLPEILAAYERVVILQALQINGWSRSQTAASLGVDRRYLYRRISFLKIDLAVASQGRSGRTRPVEVNR